MGILRRLGARIAAFLAGLSAFGWAILIVVVVAVVILIIATVLIQQCGTPAASLPAGTTPIPTPVTSGGVVVDWVAVPSVLDRASRRFAVRVTNTAGASLVATVTFEGTPEVAFDQSPTVVPTSGGIAAINARAVPSDEFVGRIATVTAKVEVGTGSPIIHKVQVPVDPR